MCEHGDTVDCRVWISAELSHTGEGRWDWKPIDRCIAPLVDALNHGSELTCTSCCGHGKGPGEIVLYDGQVLRVHQGEE